MYPIKATIRRDKGRWSCSDPGWTAYGRTPREAYDRWAGKPTFSESDSELSSVDSYTQLDARLYHPTPLPDEAMAGEQEID